ncbi:NTP transferase domain-containing protein [Candidatus Micrarchaeota archaeon]|nr:NTP transferase domain-containing protein [Candidatus Micrarchaeota archaeon]MBD3417628.1 NTP transferase domain-containing protein [Candidatus Micrarchaeota archaeon]
MLHCWRIDWVNGDSMKAVVLCGGEGTRLRPYTYIVPKPMLWLGGRHILEYTIEHLRKSGIKDITLSVGYLKEQIMNHFEDGSKFGVNIDYFVEDEALFTAGALYPHKDKLKDERFLVFMGDHVTNINIEKFIKTHEKTGAVATIAAKKKKVSLEYGIIDGDEKTKIINGFEEKPVVNYLINTGMYLLEPKALEYIKPKEDFAKNVFPRMLKANEKLGFYKFSREYWIDIGRVKDYERMRELFSVIDLARDLSPPLDMYEE